jgi:AcrR family transcriptional regulator
MLMSKSSTLNKWLETGYDLFAQEGPEGLQIERLARILALNKSGFYHYFGDIENFSKQLIKHHYTLFDQFLKDVEGCNNVDPEYAMILLKHKATVMAQMHLVRNKSNPIFYGMHKDLDDKVNRAVIRIWADHLEIHNNPDLIYQYHSMIRDMFYSRITWEKFNYEFLHELAEETKQIVRQIHTEKEKSLNP